MVETYRDQIEHYVCVCLMTFPDDSATAGGPEFQEQQLHAMRFKREMAEAAGGLLTIQDVQALLGHKTKQAIYKAVRERRLLAVTDGGHLRFPACQFRGNRVYHGVQAILEAARNITGWRILQYLFSQDEGLGGQRPVDLIQGRPKDIERAVRFARRLDD